MLLGDMPVEAELAAAAIPACIGDVCIQIDGTIRRTQYEFADCDFATRPARCGIERIQRKSRFAIQGDCSVFDMQTIEQNR